MSGRRAGSKSRLANPGAAISAPRFHDEVATFEVEFPKHTLLDPGPVAWLGGLVSEINDRQRLALALARRGEPLDNAVYRQVTGLGDSRLAGRHLGHLVDQGLLEMHGTRRWGALHTQRDPRSGPRASKRASKGASDEPREQEVARRRQWVLQQIDAGETVRRPHVRAGLVLSDKVARTLLEGIVADGLIVFTGGQRTGSNTRTSPS